MLRVVTQLSNSMSSGGMLSLYLESITKLIVSNVWRILDSDWCDVPIISVQKWSTVISCNSSSALLLSIATTVCLKALLYEVMIHVFRSITDMLSVLASKANPMSSWFFCKEYLTFSYSRVKDRLTLRCASSSSDSILSDHLAQRAFNYKRIGLYCVGDSWMFSQLSGWGIRINNCVKMCDEEDGLPVAVVMICFMNRKHYIRVQNRPLVEAHAVIRMTITGDGLAIRVRHHRFRLKRRVHS